MTCNNCLGEPCTCNENRTCTCPDIVWAWQIDISTETEWQVEIFAPENSTVSSNDESVNIIETSNSEGSTNYDLSVTCCDKKVWACANDPLPNTLDNKLFVSSPLTKTVSWCSTDGRVTIWINTSSIPDEKVKVESWCPSGYLIDAIEAWDWIRTYVQWCKLIIEAEPESFTKPMAKVYLSADAEILRTHALVSATEYNWYFIIPVTETIDNNWNNISDWITFENKTMFGSTTKWIKVNKDWFYKVSFKFNCDINYWVHALRWCVFSTMNGKWIVLDDKDQWESYWYWISQNATIDAKDDIWYAKQLSFTSNDITFLEAWTVLFLWGRLDPYVIHWSGSWKDGWISVKRAWLETWWGWSWLTTENSEAGCIMSVSRDTDANGWILYK